MANVTRSFFALLAVITVVPSVFAAEWREKAIPIVKSEKKVVDALFSRPRSLWVSVKDDGSRRDGFADYICLTLSDAGMPAGERVTITVWDAASMAKDELKELGKSLCSK